MQRPVGVLAVVAAGDRGDDRLMSAGEVRPGNRTRGGAVAGSEPSRDPATGHVEPGRVEAEHFDCGTADELGVRGEHVDVRLSTARRRA